MEKQPAVMVSSKHSRERQADAAKSIPELLSSGLS